MFCAQAHTFNPANPRTTIEQLLSESELRFRATFGQAAVGLAHVGLDGRWLRVNRRLCDITGYSETELLSRTYQEITHPDDLSVDLARTRDLISGRISHHTVEKRYLTRDGQTTWVKLTGSLVRDDKGEPSYFIAVVEDINARKAAESELAESERLLQQALQETRVSNERFRRLIDANLFGVFTWTMDGRITDGNDAFFALIGHPREDAISGDLSWRAISSPVSHDDDQKAIAELQRTGVCPTYEKVFQHSSGAAVPVLVAAALFPGVPDEGIAIAIDLTERKAQETFEQEFLAGIAHDLKNPLAAMKAQTQLMRRRLHSGRLSDGVAEEGLISVDSNVTRVVRRIDELTDIALVRAGHSLELTLSQVDLIDLARRRVELIRQRTDMHTLTFDAQKGPLIGEWDRVRIERVLDNLLSNALTFTPNGGTIDIRLTREMTPQGDWVELSIASRGEGVSTNDLSLIFHPAWRSSVVKGRLSGPGVSLAASRLLVEQHHGALSVKREKGLGSIFTLRLPLSPSSASAETGAPPVTAFPFAD